MTLSRMTTTVRDAAISPFGSLFGLARHIVAAGLAGLVTGLLVGGVGGRLFMRIAGAAAADTAQGRTTEAGFTVGQITAGGSLGLIMFVGTFVGITGAVLYLVFRPWLARTGRWRGVAYGLMLFAVGSATSDVMNPDNIDFRILGNQALVVAMIVALFVAFGLVMDWLFGVVDRRLPAGEGSGRWAYTLLALAGVGAGGLATPFLLFNREACDCDPPIIASTFVVIAAVGTAISWWNTVHRSRLWTVTVVFGLTGVTGAAVFGLIRAVSDAVEILG